MNSAVYVATNVIGAPCANKPLVVTLHHKATRRRQRERCLRRIVIRTGFTDRTGEEKTGLAGCSCSSRKRKSFFLTMQR